MKLFKAKLEDGVLSVEQSSEEHMTANQKFILWLAAIGGTTLAVLVYMVGWVALVCAVVALLLCGVGMLMKD